MVETTWVTLTCCAFVFSDWLSMAAKFLCCSFWSRQSSQWCFSLPWAVLSFPMYPVEAAISSEVKIRQGKYNRLCFPIQRKCDARQIAILWCWISHNLSLLFVQTFWFSFKTSLLDLRGYSNIVCSTLCLAINRTWKMYSLENSLW